MFMTFGNDSFSVGCWLNHKMTSLKRQDKKARQKNLDRRIRTGDDPWMALSLPPVRQIGIVARDLQKTVEHYRAAYGIGPWFRTRFTVQHHYLKGKRRAYFDLDIALAFAGKIQYEVIEHKGGDRSIYLDHLEKHGEGVHHLGFYVSDFDKRLAACTGCGIRVLQSGVLKSGGDLGGSTTKYAYLDTVRTGGVIFELIETSTMGMKIKASRPWFELGALMGDLEKMDLGAAARKVTRGEALSDYWRFCFKRWSGLS
jgi:catechol 2,3-dioxygenase-like lactoylglutathione lyase family enzyme